MGTVMSAEDVLLAAANFVATLRSRSDEIEKECRLPKDLALAFADAGFYSLLVPEIYGGLEIDPIRYAKLIQTLAQGDASAAWCVMIASTTGLTAAYMPEATAREIFAPEHKTLSVGVFAPMGKALPEKGGYRVSGQWQWGSGSPNAHWFAGGCAIVHNGEIKRMSNGLPLSRMVFVPANQVEILDTWHVSGLCGTGSTDFAIHEVFVPSERTVGIITDTPLDRPLYSFPIFSLLATGISSVCLGIARAALDELERFANQKTPQGSFKPLAKRQETQLAVARAEALLRSAKAWLNETIEAAWDEALNTGEITPNLKRDLRLAAANGATASAQAVTIAYHLGGGTSVYRRSPLQRHFRDINVATQHMMVGSSVLEQAGRLFLNLETDTSML